MNDHTPIIHLAEIVPINRIVTVCDSPSSGSELCTFYGPQVTCEKCKEAGS